MALARRVSICPKGELFVHLFLQNSGYNTRKKKERSLIVDPGSFISNHTESEIRNQKSTTDDDDDKNWMRKRNLIQQNFCYDPSSLYLVTYWCVCVCECHVMIRLLLETFETP